MKTVHKVNKKTSVSLVQIMKDAVLAGIGKKSGEVRSGHNQEQCSTEVAIEWNELNQCTVNRVSKRNGLVYSEKVISTSVAQALLWQLSPSKLKAMWSEMAVVNHLSRNSKASVA